MWRGRLANCLGLAVDPLGLAVLVMFAFPNWDSSLGFIDYVAAGVEGWAAMGRADSDPNGDVADGEWTDSMDTCCGFDAESFDRFGDYALAFFFRERFVGGVFESLDSLAFVVVANPAFEGYVGAGGVMEKVGSQGLHFDGIFGDGKRHIA
jgi:hypothetical protein